MNKLIFTLCLAFLAFVQLPAASAEDTYIEDKLCSFSCHKDMRPILNQGAHSRAYAGDAVTGCQTCHGPGAAHNEVAEREVEKEKPSGPWKTESFKKAGETPALQNRPCLACHEKKPHSANWVGSTHDMNGVTCADCHTLHTTGDTLRKDACYTCHQTKRAQVQHSANPTMPRKEGAKECAKCHDVHGGGAGPSQLKSATVNDNCYSCHAEKRGPFLWEHAPVRQNCAECHDPHGGPNTNLLKTRMPYLCQTCHSENFHPSQAYNAAALANSAGAAGAANQNRMVGKSCANCHPMIHGSNHPSGSRLSR